MRKIFLLMLCTFVVFAFDSCKEKNLNNYVMSKKLDGIHGKWDSKELRNSFGLPFKPPKNWTSCFPSFRLEGEIYANNLGFEKIATIVNNLTEYDGWKLLKYHVFDVPDVSGNLFERLDVLRRYLDKKPCSNIVIIKQYPAISYENIRNFSQKCLSEGAEGAVVRDINGVYDDAIVFKQKKFSTDECEVFSINKGKGSSDNLMISIGCKNLKNKNLFKIGAGFSPSDRKNPPKVGSIIVYKYYGLKDGNIPEDPLFLKVKE